MRDMPGTRLLLNRGLSDSRSCPQVSRGSTSCWGTERKILLEPPPDGGLHGFLPEASFQTGIRPSRYSRGSASTGTRMPSLTHPQFDTACWSLSLRSKKNAPAAGSNELCLLNANSEQTWERKNTKNILAYLNTILKSAGWVLWNRDLFIFLKLHHLSALFYRTGLYQNLTPAKTRKSLIQHINKIPSHNKKVLSFTFSLATSASSTKLFSLISKSLISFHWSPSIPTPTFLIVSSSSSLLSPLGKPKID